MIRVQSFVADFWMEGCLALTRNAAALLEAAGEEVTAENVIRIIRSAPRSRAQIVGNKLGGWALRSYCGQCMLKLDEKIKGHEDLGDYFLNRLPVLDGAAIQMLEESVIGVLRGFTKATE